MPECIVRVLSDGEVVDCVRRRLVSLPDGRDAVSYGGILFPVQQPGSLIDVSVEGHRLEELSVLDSGAPANHTIRLYLDNSGTKARLMVDGDTVVRDHVAAVLDEASIPSTVGTESNARADDNRCYDWCFELEKDAVATELKHHLDLLRAGQHDCTGLPEAVSPPPAQNANAGLTSANIEITRDGPRGLVPREHKPAFDDLPSSAACRLVIERFRDLLSMKTSPITRPKDPLSAVNIAKWRERLAEGPRMAGELLEELITAEQQVGQLNYELADAMRERDRLKLRVAKKVSVSKVLSEVFPEIEFVNDSTRVIDEDFTSMKALGSALRAILSNDPATPQARIKGAKQAWYEVRVATGTRSNGRVYFHRVSPTKVQVLVSFKVDQTLDTTWIRSLS